jgi:hypothetical protein
MLSKKKGQEFLQTLKRLFIFRLHYTIYFSLDVFVKIVSYVLTYDDLRSREWASQFSLKLNFLLLFQLIFFLDETNDVCEGAKKKKRGEMRKK